VDDLEALAKELEGGDYRVALDLVQLDGRGRIFTADPIGNRVELTQQAGKA
jgi:hypothetical protein